VRKREGSAEMKASWLVKKVKTNLKDATRVAPNTTNGAREQARLLLVIFAFLLFHKI